MSKDTKVNVTVWAILLLVTGLTMTLTNWKWLRLGRTTKNTEARVIGYVPENHQSYRYQYWVGGQPFQGVTPAADRRLEDIKLGERVTVFYDEQRPANSTVAEPFTVFVETIGLIVAACAVVPVALLCMLRVAPRLKAN